MKARAKIDDAQVAKMMLTIELTMTVDEWRKLMRDLPSGWPGWKVSEMISSCLGHVSNATDARFGVGE